MSFIAGKIGAKEAARECPEKCTLPQCALMHPCVHIPLLHCTFDKTRHLQAPKRSTSDCGKPTGNNLNGGVGHSLSHHNPDSYTVYKHKSMWLGKGFMMDFGVLNLSLPSFACTGNMLMFRGNRLP